MPADESLPGTLKRSPKKAQETWLKTHDSAAEQYGDGERAHRTAFKSLKHSFEKVDDHWEPKDEKGPSDPRSTHRGKAARDGRGEALGGRRLPRTHQGRALRASSGPWRRGSIEDGQAGARAGDRPEAGLTPAAPLPVEERLDLRERGLQA